MPKMRILKIFLVFVTITLLCNVQFSDSLRILGIHAFQARSHLVMFEKLMQGLAAKGHQVDVYGYDPIYKPVPNLTDFSLNGLLPPIPKSSNFDEAFDSDGVEAARFWIKLTQESLCDLLGQPIFQKLIHDPPKDPPYDVVITELSMVHCYIPLGRQLNVPVVGLVTVLLYDWQYEPFGTPINLAMEPTITSHYYVPMTFFQRLGNFIDYYRMNHMYYQITKVQDEIVKNYFGPGFSNGFDIQKDVSLVLVNHNIALSGMRSFALKVIPVGGLHIVDYDEPLNEYKCGWMKVNTAAFTLGTYARIETLPKHILEAFYEAFKNIAPVRVLLRIEKPEELPSGLPSNVLTQPWFQQILVLKHKNTKVFVTHGGSMGGQEASYFGVPMVGIPIFRQHFNVGNYVKRKIAVQIELPEITGPKFTSAINEVLNNPIYRKSIRKLSQQFKDRSLTPMDTAIFWIEYIHRHGKDALKSPSEDLLWWQKSLLDIYAFLGGIVLTSLFVVIKIIKKFYNLALKSNDKLKKH